MALVAKENWKIWNLDVKSSFLNGPISEDIFIEQLERSRKKGKENKVCKPVKALYGLKQAPRAWYERKDITCAARGFKHNENEPTLYVMVEKGLA